MVLEEVVADERRRDEEPRQVGRAGGASSPSGGGSSERAVLNPGYEAEEVDGRRMNGLMTGEEAGNNCRRRSEAHS